LTKVLQSLNVNSDESLNEAIKFIDYTSEITLEDALPLLSSHFAANKIYNRKIKK
jgi:hypothetical protein